MAGTETVHRILVTKSTIARPQRISAGLSYYSYFDNVDEARTDAYEVSETEPEEAFVLVGYPIPHKRLTLPGVEYITNNKWSRLASSTMVSPIGNSRFVFRFRSQEEINAVLRTGPWVFDGVIMGLKQVESNDAVADVNITEISFWVQLRNLPSHCFKESSIRRIAGPIGTVREISLPDEDGTPYQDFVRVRVTMDLRKSFPPAIKLKKENRWVYIKYEKLPSICKYCGLITHYDDDCRMMYSLTRIPQKLLDWAMVPMSDSFPHFPFGRWLCAQPYRN